MKLLRAVLLFAVLFGAGYLYAAVRLFPAAEDPTDVDFTEIPDLTGVSLAEAGERLSALGLVSAEQGRLHHGEIPAGAVVAQRPLPGQLARAGDTIVLTASAGIETRRVPDLAGLPGGEAATLLTRLGFEIDIEETDESAAAGAIRTEPPRGRASLSPPASASSSARGRRSSPFPISRAATWTTSSCSSRRSICGSAPSATRSRRPRCRASVIFQSPAPGSALRGEGLVSVIVAGTPPDSATADLARGRRRRHGSRGPRRSGGSGGGLMDFKSAFTKNWPYKLAAIVLSVLLWLSVSAEAEIAEQPVSTLLEIQVSDSAWSLREVRPAEITTTFRGRRNQMFAARFERPVIRKVLDQIEDTVVQVRSRPRRSSTTVNSDSIPWESLREPSPCISRNA